MLSIILETIRSTSSFPNATPQVTPQVPPQVIPQVTAQVRSLLNLLLKRATPLNREEIQQALKLKDRKSFRERYLKPALESGLIEMTIPDKPNSRLQQYRLTELGQMLAYSHQS